MNDLLRRVLKNSFILILYYCSLLFCFYLLLLYLGEGNKLSANSFLNWDAGHYFKIAKNGYNDIYTSAFFPLFPFIWKFTGLNPIGISILNGLVYILSFSLLFGIYKWSTKFLLIAISTPSLIFMFLPYSEATFFISSSILLVGFYRNNKFLICLGLVLCGLARPVTTVFIPAILMTEFISKKSNKEFLYNSFLFVFFSFVGLALSLLLQYLYTGSFTSFFEAQKEWGNSFQMPNFPLTSWAGGKIVKLDGSALLIGAVAGFSFLIILRNYIYNKINSTRKDILFSILYLSGICLLIFLVRGGSLFSLNRFVFATPFFLLGFYYFMQNVNFTYKSICISFFAILLFWLMCGSYVHIQTFLSFFILTCFLSLFLLLNSTNAIINKVVFFTILICNVSLQIYLFYRFISGEWVA